MHLVPEPIVSDMTSRNLWPKLTKVLDHPSHVRDGAVGQINQKEGEAELGVVDTSSRPQSSNDEDEDDIIIVAWEEDDPENPYNWSTVCRLFPKSMIHPHP